MVARKEQQRPVRCLTDLGEAFWCEQLGRVDRDCRVFEIAC